jgi:preprotein translocase subunit SecA
VDTPEDYEAAWPEAVEKARRAVAAEHEEVVGVGGLYVLGTERHESRRIDNQLRGRSGRQGDPGESRFYLSLEDDLMRMFNADKVAHFMEWLKTPPDVPIESKAVTRSIRSAQTQVEQQNFEIRKDVLKYDDVLNRQRQVIYGERRTVLEGADLHEQIRQMIDEVVTAYVTGATGEGFPEEWDLDQLWTAFRDLYHPTLTVTDMVEDVGGERSALSQEFITEFVRTDAQDAYNRREAELTPEVTRELERRVVLAVLDHKWREHLYEMDYLREGIGLRAMAQRDPLVEYQREGFDMFNTMMEGIKEESVAYLFNSKVDVQASPIVEETADQLPAAPLALGHVPGNGAPGPIEDSVAPADAAPADGAPAQRTGRRGSGGRGSRGRHAKGASGQPAGAQAAGAQAAGAQPAGARPQAARQPSAGAPGAPAVATPGLSQPRRPDRLSYSAPTVDGEAQVQRRSEPAAGGEFGKVGRNAPCPCGSGRKYKLCHGDPRNRPAG